MNNDDSSQDKSTSVCKDADMVEGEGKRLSKLGKPRSRVTKVEYPLDYGADADADQHGQGAPTSREEKVSSLKTVSFHSHVFIFIFCESTLHALVVFHLFILAKLFFWLFFIFLAFYSKIGS